MHFTYTDKDILDGRFEFRQSGTFRVLSQFAALKIAIACIFEVMFALYSLGVLFGGGAVAGNISIIIIKIALAVILPILPIWYIMIVAGGEQQYSYYADERLMRIASKRHTYIFKYTDVENVTYKPMTLFTKQKGYNRDGYYQNYHAVIPIHNAVIRRIFHNTVHTVLYSSTSADKSGRKERPMKKALLLICAASILAGMCGCSKTIENPLGINPDSRTTSSTTPVPQTVTPQTTAVTTAATSTQTTKAETTTAKPETSNTSITDKSETKKPSPAPAQYTPVGSPTKYKINKFSLMYDDGVYFNTGVSEYEEDKNELYLVHYSDDGEITSNIVAMCSDEDEDTKGRTVAEIGEEFMSYYVVGDNVDSSTKSMVKIGNTDAFYGTVKSSDGDNSVAATQHIYFARHGNKVYTLIALHLDNNEEAVTKALEYTLGSMSFDNSVNT